MADQERQRALRDTARALEAIRPSQGPREHSATCILRMIDAWLEIEGNWTASDVGLGDTPEERALWEESFLAAGRAIVRLGELIVEP